MLPPDRSFTTLAKPPTKRSGSAYSSQEHSSLSARAHLVGTGEMGDTYGCVDWFMYVRESRSAEPAAPSR